MNWLNPYLSRFLTSRASFQSSAFSPALFSGGEGGRRPDEGVLAELVTNGSRNLHFSHSYRASLQSSAFSPALLSGGEGGRRPDEGALHQNVIRAGARFSIRLKRGGDDRAAQLLPPHPAFGHLLPPQKARGEKALDWKDLQETRRVSTSGARRVCELLGRRRSA